MIAPCRAAVELVDRILGSKGVPDRAAALDLAAGIRDHIRQLPDVQGKLQVRRVFFPLFVSGWLAGSNRDAPPSPR